MKLLTLLVLTFAISHANQAYGIKKKGVSFTRILEKPYFITSFIDSATGTVCYIIGNKESYLMHSAIHQPTNTISCVAINKK